jgi:NAD(P)-dependent dehydrogenase (short-subunit alcohol dehydrogenase family)
MSTTWFVTGASSGIGAAIVDASLVRGDTVVATFRDAEGAQRFAASSAHAIGVLADVRSTEQVDAAVAHAVEVCGGLDVVVNAAGYGLVGAVEELSDDELRDQVDLNLFGTQRVI